MVPNRGSLTAAVILIGLGIWFLMAEFVPGVHRFAYESNNWPIPILGVGILFLLSALVGRIPGLYIPGAIILGIGGLLFYQNTTGNWESWAYAWSFIPGFVGIGLLLAGVADRSRGLIIASLWLLFVSVMLFGIFGSFLGQLKIANVIWPAALILVGLGFLFPALMPKRQKS